MGTEDGYVVGMQVSYHTDIPAPIWHTTNVVAQLCSDLQLFRQIQGMLDPIIIIALK